MVWEIADNRVIPIRILGRRREFFIGFGVRVSRAGVKIGILEGLGWLFYERVGISYCLVDLD